MNLSRTLCAALLLAALACAPVFAQSSARAEISSIMFSLIDLDLTDGITPSLTFTSPVPFGESTAGWEIYDGHTGFLVNQEVRGTEPLGTLAVSRLRSDLPHTVSDLAASISGTTLADKALRTSASMLDRVGENTSTAWLRSGYVAFVLTPNTSVTLSADLLAMADAGGIAGPGLWATGYAAAYMGLAAQGDTDWSTARLEHNAVFGQDRGSGVAQTFSLTRANASNAEGAFVLGFQLQSTAYTSPIVAPPVPEPATYAMLLAGLGLLAARARFLSHA